MRFSSIIYERQEAKRWDTTDLITIVSILVVVRKTAASVFAKRCLYSVNVAAAQIKKGQQKPQTALRRRNQLWPVKNLE
jgi:hypothetical protein